MKEMQSNPKQERSATRRIYETRKRMKKHGGTGLPSTLPPLDAIHAGICPLCSGHWVNLHSHPRDHFPDVSRQEARQLFLRACKLPEDTSLMTDAMRERCSLGQLAHHGRPEGKQTRDKLAKYMRGKQIHLADVPFWPIMRLIALGMTAEKTWNTLKLGAKITPHTIRKRARDHGFIFGTEGLCDQCEPYTYDRLYHLRRISGFEALKFEKCVGLAERRSSICEADRIVKPSEARLAVTWRDDVLTILLNVQPILAVAGKEYRKDEVLVTFLPEIVETNRALVASIGEIRQDARNHPEWRIEELCEGICRAAAREQSIKGNPNHSRRKTLRYLCEEESEAWLTANLERLRSTEDDGPLVRELMGSRYGSGATQQTIQNAITVRSRTQAIAPASVWALIKEYSPKLANPKVKKGRPEGFSKDTRERVRRAAGLELARWVQTRMAPYVFWDTPESCQSNIRPFLSTNRRQIDKTKKTLTRAEVAKIVRQATEFGNSARS